MEGFIFAFLITFIFLPVIFCVLFIIFLTKYIKSRKRIKELEKEINDLRYGNGNQAAQNEYAPNVMPQQNIVTQQNVMPGYDQQTFIQLPEIQSQGYAQPQAAPADPVQTYAPQAAATAVVPQPAMVSAPAYAPQITPETQMQKEIPGQAPTPSWAKPESASASVQMYQQAPVEEKKPREKFFSSINITFGIGVLLLTIVGATFMTGSWPWMTEGIRAI